MKLTEVKGKKLNFAFNNDAEVQASIYNDIYGTHAKIGSEIIGDCPEVQKVDDYLYEITVDEMDEDYVLNYAFSLGSCSEIRNGNIIGRNYDWYWDNKTSFIVRVTKKGNRHASIGVSSISISNEDIANKKYSELYKVLPFTTLDGINDCGVYCGINVVATGDKGLTTGTNKNGKNLPNICMPRFILNNATSADHAISLLRSRNIYAVNYDNQIIELHLLIADADKTYIVEFVNNKMVVLPQSDKTVMTNFYHTDWDGQIKSVALGNTVEEVKATGLTDHAEGLERYNMLKAGLDTVTSLDTGMDLMKTVNFTNAYNKQMNPFWYSELVGSHKLTIYNTKEEYEPVIDLFIEMFNNRDRNRPDTWQTVHTSCYDLINKELLISVQEKDQRYSYSLEANSGGAYNKFPKITWYNKVPD